MARLGRTVSISQYICRLSGTPAAGPAGRQGGTLALLVEARRGPTDHGWRKSGRRRRSRFPIVNAAKVPGLEEARREPWRPSTRRGGETTYNKQKQNPGGPAGGSSPDHCWNGGPDHFLTRQNLPGNTDRQVPARRRLVVWQPPAKPTDGYAEGNSTRSEIPVWHPAWEYPSLTCSVIHPRVRRNQAGCKWRLPPRLLAVSVCCLLFCVLFAVLFSATVSRFVRLSPRLFRPVLLTSETVRHRSGKLFLL